MGQVTEAPRGGGSGARRRLVETIAAARPRAHEEAARAIVDAVEELREREGIRAFTTILELAVDEDAQQRIAAALDCQSDWVPCLLGGCNHVLSAGPLSREQHEGLLAVLVIWLQR